MDDALLVALAAIRHERCAAAHDPVERGVRASAGGTALATSISEEEID
jgi:hypothetical protein